MKQNSRLLECAQYIIDNEYDNFLEFIKENDPYNHIFAVAYIGIHGEREFEILLMDYGVD